jgi:hypothetical protein
MSRRRSASRSTKPDIRLGVAATRGLLVDVLATAT